MDQAIATPPASFLTAARLGSRPAQSRVDRLLRQFAKQICRGLGPGASADVDWEDVSQESGRKLFTGSIDGYRGTGTAESYLYSLVKSTAINMFRTGSRRLRREESVRWYDEKIGTSSESRTELASILGRLVASDRDLILRIFWYGTSYENLSKELGIAESSVRSRAHRAIRRARVISVV